MRTKRYLAASLTAVLATVTLTACSHDQAAERTSQQAPLPLTAANMPDVTNAIVNADLTRVVSIDGGKLLLEPSTLTPTISEGQALTRWSQIHANTAGAQAVAITHATASIAIPSGQGGSLQFHKVPSWAVITYQGSGVTSCPSIPLNATGSATAPAQPPAREVTLVADDGTGRVESYRTRGAGQCPGSPVSGPSASAANVSTSIPWRYTRTGLPVPGYRSLVADRVAFTLPRCSQHSAVAQSADGGEIEASVALVGPTDRCAAPRTRSAQFRRLRAEPPAGHAPTGPRLLSGFPPSVFDGTAHPATVPTLPPDVAPSP